MPENPFFRIFIYLSFSHVGVCPRIGIVENREIATENRENSVFYHVYYLCTMIRGEVYKEFYSVQFPIHFEYVAISLFSTILYNSIQYIKEYGPLRGAYTIHYNAMRCTQRNTPLCSSPTVAAVGPNAADAKYPPQKNIVSHGDLLQVIRFGSV
jgi:hypothetical protein